MARKTTKTEEKKSYKEFSYNGKEFQYSGRIYPDLAKDTGKCTITPVSLTLNGLLTIKGCKLMQTDDNAWLAWPSYKAADGEYKELVFADKEYKAEELDGLVKVLESLL